MLHKITPEQRKLCEHCEYRNKELNVISFCPLSNNCPKLKNKSGGDGDKANRQTKEIC